MVAPVFMQVPMLGCMITPTLVTSLDLLRRFIATGFIAAAMEMTTELSPPPTPNPTSAVAAPDTLAYATADVDFVFIEACHVCNLLSISLQITLSQYQTVKVSASASIQLDLA